MHQVETGKLPKIFDLFFIKTSGKHVNTRFATRSTYYVLKKIETNYGISDIQYNDLSYGMKLVRDLRS